MLQKEFKNSNAQNDQKSALSCALRQYKRIIYSVDFLHSLNHAFLSTELHRKLTSSDVLHQATNAIHFNIHESNLILDSTKTLVSEDYYPRAIDIQKNKLSFRQHNSLNSVPLMAPISPGQSSWTPETYQPSSFTSNKNNIQITNSYSSETTTFINTDPTFHFTDESHLNHASLQNYSIDTITEDVEDECPVLKIPRSMINGMEGSFYDGFIDQTGTMILPKRQWKKQCTNLHDSRHFMVMSYNLLAPYYCTPSKYPGTDPKYTDWEYRRRMILDEVSYYNPSFICFQELPTSEFVSHFLSELQQMGYQGHFQKKKRDHAPDGCAIFYQSARFNLLDIQAFSYNERIPKDMPNDLRARIQPFSNIALVCIFQNRQSRALKVRIVTTHLHWDPAFSDIKLLQASLLIEWLESTNSEIPTVIAGDFNSKPGDPVMDYLIRGKVSSNKSEYPTEQEQNQEVNEPSALRSNSPSSIINDLNVNELESEEARIRMSSFSIQRQGVKLASAYNSRDLPYTNKTKDFEGVIDHILYSSGTLSIRDVLCDIYLQNDTSRKNELGYISKEGKKSELLSSLPAEHIQIAQYGLSSYLSKLKSLPTRHFPSDHVSLCAWLKWKTVPVMTNFNKFSGKKTMKTGTDTKVFSRSLPTNSEQHWLSSTENWTSMDDYKPKKNKLRSSSLYKELENGFSNLDLNKERETLRKPKKS